MKKNKTKVIIIALIWIVFFAVNFYAASAATSMVYTPMEKIPGFENTATDFPSYIMSIYKFGLWAIGICALLMISVGGYMYIGSAGNKSTAEKAKSIITDAIAGLVLALVSWLLLYLINPDLVKLLTK